jgi:hypothetical protein
LSEGDLEEAVSNELLAYKDQWERRLEDLEARIHIPFGHAVKPEVVCPYFQRFLIRSLEFSLIVGFYVKILYLFSSLLLSSHLSSFHFLSYFFLAVLPLSLQGVRAALQELVEMSGVNLFAVYKQLEAEAARSSSSAKTRAWASAPRIGQAELPDEAKDAIKRAEQALDLSNPTKARLISVLSSFDGKRPLFVGL